MPTPSGTISMLDVANEIVAQGNGTGTGIDGTSWDFTSLEADAGDMFAEKTGSYATGISFNNEDVRELAGLNPLAYYSQLSMEMLQNKPVFVWDVKLNLHSSSPSNSAFLVWNLTTENNTVIVNNGAGFDVATHAFTSFNNDYYYTGNSPGETETFNVSTGHTYTVDDGSSYVIATLRALTITGTSTNPVAYDNMTSYFAEDMHYDYMKFTSTHNVSDWSGVNTSRGNGAQWDNSGNRFNYWAYADTEWELTSEASTGSQFGDEVQIKITTLAQEAGQTYSGIGMIMHDTS
tara:strand:+ start:1998 stop:2870 length:873 start_codon:yes stop_codon:yes gene_type:complete